MRMPSETELAVAIGNATRKAVSKLFSLYSERFYYCSLITDGGAHSPTLTAWSFEALDREVAHEENPERAIIDLKWSYADSPYFEFGDEYFQEVKTLFSLRPQLAPKMSWSEWEPEYQLRLRSMETAMAKLDKEGLFGKREKRLGIVINVGKD